MRITTRRGKTSLKAETARKGIHLKDLEEDTGTTRKRSALDRSRKRHKEDPSNHNRLTIPGLISDSDSDTGSETEEETSPEKEEKDTDSEHSGTKEEGEKTQNDIIPKNDGKTDEEAMETEPQDHENTEKI